MGEKKVDGMIGITNDGYPIVLPNYVCPYFEEDEHMTYNVKECWYCRFADFRKSNEIMLENSVCRHERNRVHTRYASIL